MGSWVERRSATVWDIRSWLVTNDQRAAHDSGVVPNRSLTRTSPLPCPWAQSDLVR
jgi:hypothetical protein